MMSQHATWSVAVHGGAHEIERGQEDAHRRGCRAAVSAGAAVLRRGGPAVEAVEAAIRVLEDDPTFNAGNGSARREGGGIEMDAAIMDGSDLSLGGVAGLRRVQNPITVARLLLPEKPVLLVGEGAERFARSRGVPLAAVPARPEQVLARTDTVGAVAKD